jgi:hypothetical protein
MEVVMRTVGSILGIALAAALGGCAHEAGQSASSETSAQTSGLAQGCPLAQLRGIHATVANVESGVAVTFTAPEGELDQLRESVRAMAASNDQQGDAFAVCPCSQTGAPSAGAAMRQGSSGYSSESGQSISARESGHPGQTSMQGGGSYAIGSMPLAKSKVDDIPTGAILRLTARDTTQTNQLRSTVREDLRALKRGCMSHGG